jgi:DNA-directed RNA polymerase subunit RPC12/RpoP
MTIYRCDLCGKDISTANAVVQVGYHSYGFLASEFCADCGKPVVRFLTRVEKKLKSRKGHPAADTI